MMTMRAVLAAVLAAAAASAPSGAQQRTFKVSTRTVPIYATVTDADRRLVPDLVQEDFEIYDNGRLQEITSFDNRPLPITVVVMLDTSGSMTLALDLVKEGAEQFLLRMLPEDRGMVGAFNDKIEFLPDAFTGSRDVLIRSLKELDFGYPTRLYDAVGASLDQLKGIPGRKVALIFTDGEDNASRVDAGDMIERARAEDVMIYSVGLENEYLEGQRKRRTTPDRGLRRLSEETGGGFFLLKKTDELGPTFTRVAQELHSQYVLGFAPAALDGKVHRIEVKIRQRPSLTVRGRRSYVASAEAVTER